MSLRNRYTTAASWIIAASLMFSCASMATAQSDDYRWTSPRRSAEPRQFEADPSARAAQGPIALLIRNSDTANGKPPFALVDQYGVVQRYVEPSPGIDLASHVGSRIRVNHDTGVTLLASQLDLPSDLQPLDQNQSLQRLIAPKNQGKRGRLHGNAHDIVAVQFGDNSSGTADDRLAPLGGNDEPIVLEDLLITEANDLPAPDSRSSAESLPPIITEEILPLNDYRSNGHHHSADCPHCNKQSSSLPIQVDTPTCNCARCRAKRNFSLRKLGSDTLNLGSSSCGCDSCRAGSGSGFATTRFDAELLLFAVNDSEAELEDTQDDLEAGFRLTYNRVNAQDQIFRLRYFSFDADLQGNNNQHEMEEIDMEIGRRFSLGGLDGEFTAGIRWASFEERQGLDYDSTFGPLVGLQIRGRKILGGSSFVSLRHSWQFGDASDNGGPDVPGTFSISEAQLGLEWNRCTQLGNVVLRTAFETQYWSGVQETDSEDIGLIGWTNSIGFAF